MGLPRLLLIIPRRLREPDVGLGGEACRAWFLRSRRQGFGCCERRALVGFGLGKGAPGGGVGPSHGAGLPCGSLARVCP